MKKILTVAFVAAFALSACAQDQMIKLLPPSVRGGLSVMEALKNRQSIREYS
ncbi:MAG: lipoprotein, partial [Bacteroidales bacterium]|nr:lipoprotein [Bacteroidales bacterium]